jgi:hypothetical protein
LVSRWTDGRRGGHAYLAENINREIWVYDPHTGDRTGWPPPWWPDAVERTAVGYLDPAGNPVDPLGIDATRQLSPAEEVGDVQGHPDDQDFVDQQRAYRARHPKHRQVDTGFADPIGDVVDALGWDEQVPRMAHQLVLDLSGRYGPFVVDFERVKVSVMPSRSSPTMLLEGIVLSDDGRQAGAVVRTVYRDADGFLVMFNMELEMEEWAQRRGFASALCGEMERYCRRSGVDRIEVHARQDGGYVWARLGFDWHPEQIDGSLADVRQRAVDLAKEPSTSASARNALNDVIDGLYPNKPDRPTPLQLASLASDDTPDLGEKLLKGAMWSGVYWLREEG